MIALLPTLPPLEDFVTLSGAIAAFSVLLGSAIGIHSLRQPNMSKGRWGLWRCTQPWPFW